MYQAVIDTVYSELVECFEAINVQRKRCDDLDNQSGKPDIVGGQIVCDR
jgi:hypothetical protein